MKFRYAIWCAVSTKAQAGSKKVSLDQQETSCRQEADKTFQARAVPNGSTCAMPKMKSPNCVKCSTTRKRAVTTCS